MVRHGDNVNRTVHATDTSTNLGDILDRSGAYMSGSWHDTRHFFHSMENTYRGSSTYTNAMSMSTESGVAHQSQWNMTVNRGSMGSHQDHVFAGGYSYLYGGGNSRTDVFNLKTEVMRTSGFPPNLMMVAMTLHGVDMVDSTVGSRDLVLEGSVLQD